MTMQELENKRVKISAGTITVKDEYGKTRGMVRGIRRYDRWTNRDQSDHWQALKKSGILGNRIRELINCVILDGNKLYYLNNTKPLEDYARLKDVFESSPAFACDVQRHAERLKIAEQAAQYMTVINCYILS